ncbi:flavodoxin domain-containing protein [Streptomyces sp. NPDC094438]|uniref:flavodoxin domain-containing protein n=1 Tax=Streptomyces sp. NPDC094438 TaxID=3366061 RepID=UPI0037F20BBD
MNILVGYATAHGSTQEIAEHIGARLAEAGITADVRPMDEVDSPDGYVAFVLGSAVHGQAWLPAAKDFVRRNSPLLCFRPVWLFSVGMPGALRGPWKRLAPKEEPLIAQGLPGHLPYRNHRLLSGVVTRDHLPFKIRVIFRLMGCRYGDLRDWAAIDAWTDRIAADLCRV